MLNLQRLPMKIKEDTVFLEKEDVNKLNEL
jgi:hypothetical protein